MIREALAEIRAARRKTSFDYTDKIIVVSAGRIAASGTPREVLTDKMMREVFGVSVHVGGVPTDAPFILPHTAHAA